MNEMILTPSSMGKKASARPISEDGGLNSNRTRYAVMNAKKQMETSIRKMSHLGVFFVGKNKLEQS